MKRFAALSVFGLALAVAFPVLADGPAPSDKAGLKGYVAAYEADQKTVMLVRRCDPKGLAHDYVECGKNLRADADKEICKRKGKGDHVWWYRIGDAKQSAWLKQSEKCK